MSDRPLPSSFDDETDFYNEKVSQKVWRRLRQEPLIPIGCALTVTAFVAAYRASRSGDHQRVQRMFRARVAAQALTVVFICAGGWYYRDERQKEKDVYKIKQAEEAEIKRKKWIRELELRDEEDRAVRERLDRMRRRAEDRKANTGVAAEAAEQAEKTGAFVKDQVVAEDKANASVLSSLGGWFGGSDKNQEGSKDNTKKDTAAESPVAPTVAPASKPSNSK